MLNGAGGRFLLRFSGASAPSAPPILGRTERDSIRLIISSTVGGGAAAAAPGAAAARGAAGAPGAGGVWANARVETATIEMAETTDANLLIEPPASPYLYRRLCHETIRRIISP